MEEIIGNGSQSSVWGMDILISTGLSEYGFDRLLRIIDEFCDERLIDGSRIVAQGGSSKYIPRNYKVFSLIGRDEYQKYVDQADVIISHAGTGCVIPPLKLGKKVIVFPRREQYREHLDDHQLELAAAFAKAGYVLCANNKDELRYCIESVGEFIPRKFISNAANMNRLVIDFIDKIFGD